MEIWRCSIVRVLCSSKKCETYPRDAFFSVDRRECSEKVKSVSTVRFTPAEPRYNLFTGEVHGEVTSIKTGRMCCLALVTIDRWQNSISGTRRRIIMSCGKVVLPLLHITVPRSSLVDKRELRLQWFWIGSLLTECGWRVILSSQL